MNTTVTPLLSADRVTKRYPAPSSSRPWSRQHLVALSDFSLELHAGQTVGIVGESGCGKSTAARLLLDLETTSAGSILFDGKDVQRLSRSERRRFRATVQPVFQNPWSALNPRLRIGQSIEEPLLVNSTMSKVERRARADEVLETVGIPSNRRSSFPHEFSGGQRQRIVLARALALEPAVLILDEPMSSLDVSIRAQMRDLISDLRGRMELSYLIISHDLADVSRLADSLIVMYRGRVVEKGPTMEVLRSPSHPYTYGLVNLAMNRPFHGRDSLLGGRVPSPMVHVSGCDFQSRCVHRHEICEHDVPKLIPTTSEVVEVACHLNAGVGLTQSERLPHEMPPEVAEGETPW